MCSGAHNVTIFHFELPHASSQTRYSTLAWTRSGGGAEKVISIGGKLR